MRPEQVERLDAGGALVQRRDARVARDLLHAVLVDVAMTAEHLHAEVGALAAELGEEAFEDRRVEAELVVAVLARACRPCRGSLRS